MGPSVGPNARRAGVFVENAGTGIVRLIGTKVQGVPKKMHPRLFG